MSRRLLKTRSTRKRASVMPDAEVQQAYQRLVQVLQRADSEAQRRMISEGRSHEQVVDLREASAILDKYPRLQAYLAGVKERERERGLAQSRPDLTLSSPTGSHPQAQPLAAYWSGAKDPVGVPNARILRNLADTDPWVRAAINVRRQQVGRAEIAVAPVDSMKPYNKAVMRTVTQLLDQPNEYRDTYRSLIEPVLEDVLVLDRGVMTKDMSAKRVPQNLYYEDGATISIYPAWDGKPTSYRYLYEEPGGTRKVPLRNDECIVFIACPASHRYGLSPVQVLYDTINADIAATKSASDMVALKPPPHVLQIQGATELQLRNLRSMYEAEIAGRKEVLWLGGNAPAQVFPLTASAKDNQWLEWQIYLVRKIAAVFQVSPQQLGVTFDINKATGDTQQQIFEDTGLIPLLLLLEEQLNRELLADFAPSMAGDRADLGSLNLRIVFPEISETARQLHAERAVDIATKGLAGLPSMTLNQVLLMRGEQPVPGGNTFYVENKTLGPIPFLSYEKGDTGDYTSPVLGGELGAQGAESGPVENPPTPRVSDKPAVKPPAQPAAQPPAQGATPTAPKPAAPNAHPASKAHRAQVRFLREADTSAQHTGMMVALFLDAATAQRLAVPGGEPADHLHITLAYLGESGDDALPRNAMRSSDDRAALTACIGGFASEQSPLDGTVGGVGQFLPSPSSDGKVPVVALVDIPGLAEFRIQLVNYLHSDGFSVVGDHGFTPHITLLYLEPGEESPLATVPQLPLRFEELTLALGDELLTYQIGAEHDDDGRAPPTLMSPPMVRDVRPAGKHWRPAYLTAIR